MQVGREYITMVEMDRSICGLNSIATQFLSTCAGYNCRHLFVYYSPLHILVQHNLQISAYMLYLCWKNI